MAAKRKKVTNPVQPIVPAANGITATVKSKGKIKVYVNGKKVIK